MYPYPTYPPPPPPSPRRRRLWIWLILIPAILLVGAICALGTPAFVQGWQNGLATATAAHSTPSPQASGPRIGGTLDAFESAYGLPTKTAPDNEQFTSDKVQVTAFMNSTQTVIRVFVVGPSTWLLSDTYAFCKQFLPTDASEFSRATSTPAFIDYHSSLGEVVMQLQTPSCTLFIAPSSS